MSKVYKKNFDKIICITLDISKERHDYMNNIKKKYNIPFEFKFVKKNPKSPIIGCMESHISVIKEAYLNNLKNILIFEDDILPTPNYNEDLIDKIMKDLNKIKDWEMIQFGYGFTQNTYDIFCYTKFLMSEKINQNLIKYTGVFTHSYCLSRKGMKKILEEYNLIDKNEEKHIDIWFTEIIKNGYAVYPMLFDQKWSFPTQNKSKTIFEKIIFRPFQSYAENSKIFQIAIDSYYYRYYILLFTIIIAIYLIINIKLLLKKK